MTDVLLVTCSALPEGEAGGASLLEAFAAGGLTARWVSWDDPAVDWAGARLVAVRSPWDYDTRREEFLAWARSVEATTTLVSSARVLEWNTDKEYLLELTAAGLPVVPTLSVQDDAGLAAAIASFDPAVVKPRVGASGRGVVLHGLDPDPGPWVVQPLVGSISTEGETSVFVFGGTPVSAVRKLPGSSDIRVHEEYGGRSETAAVTEEAGSLARRTVAVAETLLGEALPYARVDLMRLDDGTLAVSELEVAEPGLYLDLVPENAKPYAEAVAALVERPAAG